jgi:hypothetical protein
MGRQMARINFRFGVTWDKAAARRFFENVIVQNDPVEA